MDSIVFDLDGTLWDTCNSCAIAWNNVVRRNEISFREINAGDVRSVAGLPHEQCIRTVFDGLKEGQIKELISGTEVEDNVMVAELGGELYDGVTEGLEDLSRCFQLFIVSNCQAGYIEIFLKNNGFEHYFKDIECWGNTKESKPSNLNSIIQRNGLKAPVYVGDTEGDEAAARECGIPFWFVSYGFGKCRTHDQVFGSFGELTSFSLSIQKNRRL